MQRSVRSMSVLLLTALTAAHGGHAQEVECTVQVNYESVASTNRDLLQDFESDLRDYVNNYQWGAESYNEKVKWTLTVFVQGVVGENRYAAQAFIGSQRPIFGTEKSSAVLRLMDETWEFTYIRNRPINHNLYSFNDLASFLDFYTYLVLGYDADTYDVLAGTPFFQKAADIANLGRSSGQKGWEATASSYSRTQLIDELLNLKFEPMRAAQYTYHFGGLDSLLSGREKAYANILRALEAIGKAKAQVDPRNYVIKIFFDTKYLEISDVLAEYSDPNIFITLSRMDPTHTKTYEEYRTRQR